jgi:SAM-dependent methyltransferase
MSTSPAILDPACGSRMFYFDPANQGVLFGDCRREEHVLCDGRKLIIKPDMQLDFRALPFPDESFSLICFDPPHLVRAGRQSWLALKYGRLSANWQKDIAAGFGECFRVLKPEGTLIFKWNETQVPLAKVIGLSGRAPVFGNKRPEQMGTHWLVFFKGDEK